MSERTLYMSLEDERNLVKWIFECGARLVPDIHYAAPSYNAVANQSEFIEWRARTRNFFVIHDSFTKTPLELVRNESGQEHWYIVMPRNGGPAINLLLAGEFREGNVEYVRPGDVGYYRTYWDPKGQENKPAPKEEVSFYTGLIQAVKKDYFVLRTKHRVYCVGPGAREILRRGGRLAGLEDSSYAELDLKPFR